MAAVSLFFFLSLLFFFAGEGAREKGRERKDKSLGFSVIDLIAIDGERKKEKKTLGCRSMGGTGLYEYKSRANEEGWEDDRQDNFIIKDIIRCGSERKGSCLPQRKLSRFVLFYFIFPFSLSPCFLWLPVTMTATKNDN